MPYTKGVIAKATIQLGADISKANLLKITGNAMVLGMVEIVAEALVVAEKSGLGTENLDNFIQLMFPNSPFAGYSKRMISGEYAPIPPNRPGFQVDIARKDCKHAMDIAEKCGARLEVVEIMDRHLKIAKDVGGSNMDIRYSTVYNALMISTTYGALRKEAGLKFSDTID